MTTNFPTRARRDDPNGHMVVQYLLEFLRDKLDEFMGKTLQGSDNVPNAATSITVTHSLNRSTYSVIAVPMADPGGRYWVSNKTATTFDFNLQTAAGIGGLPFDWLVKGV